MSGEAEPGARAVTPRWRLWLWAAAAVIVGLNLLGNRGEAAAIVLTLLASVALLVVLAFAVRHVEATDRPRKTYLRWALGAAVLGLALVIFPLAIGAGIVVGLILWTGFSAAGLAWAHYYERSEPL